MSPSHETPDMPSLSPRLADEFPNLVASAVNAAMKRWPEDPALSRWWQETGYPDYCYLTRIATLQRDSPEEALKDFVEYWKPYLEVSRYDSCRNFLFWAMESLDHCQKILESGTPSLRFPHSKRPSRSSRG